MDYLINEGYPDAAMNFAKEASIVPSADGEAIQERVDIRNAIHTGDMQLAIERINELNPQVRLTLLSFPSTQVVMIIRFFHAPRIASGIDDTNHTHFSPQYDPTTILSSHHHIIFSSRHWC